MKDLSIICSLIIRKQIISRQNVKVKLRIVEGDAELSYSIRSACHQMCKGSILIKMLQSYKGYVPQIRYYYMSFFNKIKEAFGSKPVPKFKTYQPSELKMLSMKTRIILEKHMETLFQQITKDDQQFKYAGQDPFKLYNILQEIGQKVIEAESIKILVQMMRKVENFSPQIIQTNGDIAHLRKEILWFQCVLWYRKSREKTDLEDLYHFCFDFFKGVDITTQLDVHCEVFQLYPILKYLPKKGAIPLSELLPYIQPYVSCDIDQPTLDNILDINRSQIRKGGDNQPQGQSYIHPGQINQPQSKFYPKSHIYTPFQSQQPKNQPSNINPYQSNSYKQDNQGNPPFYNPLPNNYSQVYNNSQFNSNSPSKNPQQPYGGNLHQTNTFNGPANNISNVDPYNLPNMSPYSNDSNTLNINANQNYFSRIDNPQPQHQPQPQFQPHQTPSPSRQSFYNTIMRGSLERQREPIERDQHDHYGSKIPLNRETHQQFNDVSFEQTMKQLEQIQKKQSQSKLEREKEQREREQREKKQKQQMEIEQRRVEEIRQRKEQQEKAKKEQEEQRIREELLKRQEEERREKEEVEREREQQNRRRERQRQMEQRDNDFQINVFRDNERQSIDRGTSERFSANFGMKIDFGDHREEDFNYESPSNIQNSLLRFKQTNNKVESTHQNSGLTPEEQLNSDQRQSINIINKNTGCSPATDFKLFYFKKTQTS